MLGAVITTLFFVNLKILKKTNENVIIEKDKNSVLPEDQISPGSLERGGISGSSEEKEEGEEDEEKEKEAVVAADANNVSPDGVSSVNVISTLDSVEKTVSNSPGVVNRKPEDFNGREEPNNKQNKSHNKQNKSKKFVDVVKRGKLDNLKKNVEDLIKNELITGATISGVFMCK